MGMPRTSHHTLTQRSAAILAAGLSGSCIALTGCSTFGPGAPPCMPPTHSVSPSTVEIGETVTVHAQDVECDPRYGGSAEIQVIVTDSLGRKIIDTTAPMNDAGGFSYSFEVPEEAATGKAAVEAYPHNVDWCDDTGRNNRVSEADVSLQRVSCAARIEPLTITG